MANHVTVDAHDRLATRIRDDQDDVLASLQLVRGDGVLEDHLWGRLVGLLVESLFVDLRRERLDGAIEPDEHRREVAELAEQCRAAGLLPLAARS